jgi:hypothetical protein
MDADRTALPLGGVSEFGISGEVASDDDFVDVHNGDLGLMCVFRDRFRINFDVFTMRHVAATCKENLRFFLSLMIVLESFAARYITVLRIVI